MNAMNRKEKVEVLVIIAAFLLICFTIFAAFEPGKEDFWVETRYQPTRAVWWYKDNCDYVEIDPADNTALFPDGIYVNCR